MADDTPTDDGTGANPDDDGTPTDDSGLGDAGKAALKAERTRAATAEKAAKALQKRLDELETANLDEVGRAVKTAADTARQETLNEVRTERVKDKVEVAATGKLSDPGDAAAFLGDLTRFVGDDGAIDSKAITSAIDELVKTKPYLAPAGSRPSPLPGGGARPTGGSSMNDALRQALGH